MPQPDQSPISVSAEHFGPLAAALAERYRIERELGAGGMATVYLAEDVKHHRKVAIKVLHAELSAILGPERFLKEIELTANLQHPNILPLFDSGTANGLLYYVMPYVDGETLRERLLRESQLSVPDSVQITCDVADALAYAHRHGVIHRDIKPENILLHEGRALVADFGIGLAVEQAAATRMTQTGLSLGTPQYMSPEQAMGERHISPRSDIYSLGAVAYEMLIGDPPFTGSTAQAIVAQSITGVPRSLIDQRKSVPSNVNAAVLRALEKLPADRFATAADFSIALASDASTTPTSATPPAPEILHARAPRRATYGWVAMGLILGFVAGSLLAGVLSRYAASPSRARDSAHRSIFDPNVSFNLNAYSRLAISPDGNTVVAMDGSDTHARLSLRHIDQLVGTPIPGTDGASSPFISWDSRTLGFVKASTMYTVPIEGGVPTAVPVARTVPVGAPAWTRDGRIVFTDLRGGLTSIHVDGSALHRLTAPDSMHIHVSPNVLPNGSGVLFTIAGVATGVFAQSRSTAAAVTSIDGGAVHIVNDDAKGLQYDDGRAVFVRGDGALATVPFDQSSHRATGPAELLGDWVSQTLGGVANLAVGHNILIYQRATKARLMMLDRTGATKPLLQQLALYHRPSVSPDGRTIALDISDDREGLRDVWTLDIASGLLARLTHTGNGHDANWTPDGRQVSFFTNDRAGGNLFTVPVDRSGPPKPFPFPPQFESRLLLTPGNWLPKGRAYLGGTSALTTLGDIWLLPVDGSAPQPLAVSPADEHSPTASPDGRWFAFVSNETGEEEVYVQAMMKSGARTQISRSGGVSPVWSPTGHSIYYLEPVGNVTNLIEVRLKLEERPSVASRQQLVADLVTAGANNHANFAVMPDDRHFVVVLPEAGQGMVEVTGWAAGLAKH